MAVDHAAIMNSCDAKMSRHGLSSLSDAERNATLVSRADFELELGGFTGFWYNSASDYAIEMAAALDAIGASNAAKGMRQACSLFPKGAPSRDREERFREWKSIEA